MKGTTNAEKGGQGIIVKDYSFTMPYRYYRYASGSYVQLYTLNDSDVPMVEEISEMVSNHQVMMVEISASGIGRSHWPNYPSGYCIPKTSALGGGVSHVVELISYFHTSTNDASRGTFFKKETNQTSYDLVPTGKWHYYCYTGSGSTVPSDTGTGTLSIRLYALAGGGN